METALAVFGIAVITSVIVDFLLAWQTRLRLRRVEIELGEWEERLAREVKQRAAKASVEARTKLNPLDEALIRQHTQHPREIVDGTPWWHELIGGKFND